MWDVPKYEKLSDEEIEDITEQFTRFYNNYADEALPGQVTFVDSIYDQFTENLYLSEKQIMALDNIIAGCEEFNAAQEEQY